MKIKLYGTGSSFAKSFGACALINDEVLVECSSGIVKRLRQDNIDFANIKVLIISHYHGCHDWEVPFLLGEMAFKPRSRSLTIIAPKGFAKRHGVLCDLIWQDMFSLDKAKSNMNLTILELQDNKIFKVNGYEIKSFKMKHRDVDAYGFRVKKDGKVCGFTGDTRMIENVKNIVRESNISFVEVAYPPAPRNEPMHISVAEYMQLCKEFSNIPLVPYHMTDESREALAKLGVAVPNDNDVFVV